MPLLCDWVPNLVDDRPDHDLWQGTNPASGGRARHFTNIRRVEMLARSHPLVHVVEYHKADYKAEFNTQKNALGRAMQGHQSEHDLRLTMAASGAQLSVGVSANKVHNDMLSLWWTPGKNLDTIMTEICQCVCVARYHGSST